MTYSPHLPLADRLLTLRLLVNAGKQRALIAKGAKS